MATVAAAGVKGSISVDVTEAKFFQKSYSVRVTSPLIRLAHLFFAKASMALAASDNDDGVKKSQIVL